MGEGTKGARARAERFAEALDREDYAAAGDYLAAACVYVVGETVVRGRGAVIDSYRRSGEWAAGALEAVAYDSEVREASEGRAVIRFYDRIRHGGREFTHTSEQVLIFDAEGRIVSIRHVELPGEAEALESFLDSLGVPRRTRGGS